MSQRDAAADPQGREDLYVTAPGLSLASDVKQLAEEARAFAVAELAFQKSRAAYAGAQAKGIAGLVAAAAVLLVMAVFALIVGLVIALGTVWGPWIAMLTVTGGLLLLTFAALLTARARWRATLRAIADGDA